LSGFFACPVDFFLNSMRWLSSCASASDACPTGSLDGLEINIAGIQRFLYNAIVEPEEFPDREAQTLRDEFERVERRVGIALDEQVEVPGEIPTLARKLAKSSWSAASCSSLMPRTDANVFSAVLPRPALGAICLPDP